LRKVRLFLASALFQQYAHPLKRPRMIFDLVGLWGIDESIYLLILCHFLILRCWFLVTLEKPRTQCLFAARPHQVTVLKRMGRKTQQTASTSGG
jgi:hypothetical protein